MSELSKHFETLQLHAGYVQLPTTFVTDLRPLATFTLGFQANAPESCVFSWN